MPEKVLVTGGSGKLGKYTIANLQMHGYDVINADRNRAPGVRNIEVDMCNMGHVYAAMAGVDAVVHLAAIPAPGSNPPEVVFHTNVMSTFNVLEAAAALGIKKVVLASSLSALGLAYMHRPVELHYLPIDEAHPLLAQDCYGLSKIVGENMAESFLRRIPDMSLTSLRFTYVMNPEEKPLVLPNLQKDDATSVPLLWTYVDVRDAADAVRLSVEHKAPGHYPFYINAPKTFMNVPTLDLIRQFYPNLPVRGDTLTDDTAPIDCSAAAKTIGYAPKYLWEK